MELRRRRNKAQRTQRHTNALLAVVESITGGPVGNLTVKEAPERTPLDGMFWSLCGIYGSVWPNLGISQPFSNLLYKKHAASKSVLDVIVNCDVIVQPSPDECSVHRHCPAVLRCKESTAI